MAVAAEIRRAEARGEHFVAYGRTPLFAEFAERWFESKTRLRGYTAKEYRRALDLVLVPAWGHRRLAFIGPDEIVRLTRALEVKGLATIDPKREPRPLSPARIDNLLKPARGIFALALRRGLISSDPFRALTADDRPAQRERKEAYVWSRDAVETLLDASRRIAARPDAKYDYTPLLHLAERTGARLGEILGLQWRDFDHEAKTLRIERQWTRTGEYGPPKTPAAVRTIPLAPDVVEALIAHRLRSTFSSEDDPIFASREGTPLTHRNATRRGFEAAAKEAGLQGVSFHDLRHACASRLIATGLSHVVVASVLGHANPSITLRIYSHVWDRSRTDEAIRTAMAT